MFIGIDDTDSPNKYCTTYIATLLVEKFKEMGYNVEMPKLIRMNPTVKYKTRGNGGVSIRIIEDKKLSDNEKREIKDIVIEYVENYADFEYETTNPGIVFLDEENYAKNKDLLNSYYKKVLYDIVSIDYVESILKKINAEYIKYKKGYGIIGALGAISSNPPYTYELLAYRKRENWGKERFVDEKSVFEMDEKTFPFTFNNVDYDEGKSIIAPHTKCPVLYGIRGIDKDILIEAMKMIKSEEIDRYMIFKTNQGTDVHLRYMKIKDIYPNTGVIVYGKVVKEPKNLPGGHVVFRVSDGTGEIDCIAYEPTKKFRNIVRKLIVGDLVGVYGTVREKPFEINIEKLKIIKLAKKYTKDKKCECGGTLKAKGKKGGYKCRKCGKVIKYDEIKLIEVERDITEGFYEVPPSARRHLSKPILLF
ncbi:tRNA(Ile)(2)-agmatinylcytidine synthase [Methanotorris igneus]|uniref:tRNA(Ile2) 2-agmatinylcytidine synthetase TiaS n=1 Tax=Methanotorris igneus (strain DSM 5666 / JCM 11834 / Kol 5) TaxID=880724 RepID=F6BBM5_METIK|nr:tRNA(Ile)(2)-agmatinylcytidine synthase [Methanotorris igneus]AEF96034.1 domain of unknown function DUF1743 [Methanotorris igneus Kol 5]